MAKNVIKMIHNKTPVDESADEENEEIEKNEKRRVELIDFLQEQLDIIKEASPDNIPKRAFSVLGYDNYDAETGLKFSFGAVNFDVDDFLATNARIQHIVLSIDYSE